MLNKHELDDLKGVMNYRGCLVYKIIGGYSVWGIKTTTPQGIDEIIDKAGTSLNESIVTVQNNNDNWGDKK